jgi:hypothetical protein
MEQELITPEPTPKTISQAFSPLGCFLAASGVTLMTLCLLGAAMAVTVWAIAQLLELPQTAMYVLQGLGLIPVLWATAWTGGRAWHVERRLAQGLDIDTPVFQSLHYFRGK